MVSEELCRLSTYRTARGFRNDRKSRLRHLPLSHCRSNFRSLYPVFFLFSIALLLLVGCGDAQLLTKAAGAPGTAALVASTTNVTFGTTVVGQATTSQVAVTNNTSAPIEIATLSTTGQGFSAISSNALPVTVAGGANYNLTVRFAPNAPGAATGELEISSSSTKTPLLISLTGTGEPAEPFTYSGSSLVNTVTPANSSPVANDFFGMTIFDLASASSNPTDLTPFPSFQVATLRFWDVSYWAQLEPSDGTFNWTKMDRTISTAEQNGVSDFIFTFGHVPQWAAMNPDDPCNGIGTGTCSVPDMAAFDDFATQMVQRYCGTVKYYETWNEPNNTGYWDGNDTQLLAVAQDLYRIAKDPANCGCTNGMCSPNGGVNPNKVLLPPISRVTTANFQWLDAYLSTAGAQYPYADVVAFHGYDAVSPEDAVQEMPLLENVLQKHGLGNLELWDTEASWGDSTTAVTETQASWLMRHYVLQEISGVSRLVWYAYDSCNWGSLFVTPECSAELNTPVGVNDSGTAYATVQHWMTGATVTQCQQYQNGLWACELQRSGDYDAWMLWSTTGSDISVSFPDDTEYTTYRDWQDNPQTLPSQLTVGQTPVLVENQDL